MDVRLPDGTIIKNVPDGTSKADLMAKLTANGYKSSEPVESVNEPQQEQKSYTTGEALTSAAANLIPSTGKLAVDVGKAIVQPANTLQGLIQLETQKRGEQRSFREVADYSMPNVSDKMVRIIISYTDYIKRVVWSQEI
jgi:hypothetical protein